MAGISAKHIFALDVPAFHVLLAAPRPRRGCPGNLAKTHFALFARA
jgi:hypothetical protein